MIKKSIQYKITLSIVFVLIAGMAISGHYTGRVYPGVLIFYFVGLIALAVIAIYGQSLYSVLSGTLILAVGYRMYSMYIPASPVGIDTPGVVRQMYRIIETGDLSAIRSPFYSEAPLYPLLPPITSMTTGIDYLSGLYVYAILVGIFPPLIIISLLKVSGVNNVRLLGIGVVLSVSTTEVIRRGYYPMAQVHATIFWLLFLLSLINYTRKPDPRHNILLILFLAFIALTHKLPLLVIGATILVILLLYGIDHRRLNNLNNVHLLKPIFSLLVVTASITITQWLYVGNFITNVIARLSSIVSSLSTLTDAAASGRITDPVAAEQVRPGLLGELYEYPVEYILYVERMHAIWLLLFSGIAWIILLYDNSDNNTLNRNATRVLLAASAVCVGLLFFGQVSVQGMNPTRPLLLIEIILVCLIVCLLGIMSSYVSQVENSKKRLYSIGNVAFIILLVSTQVFAASAAPDYNNTPIYYIDSPEYDASETLCDITDEEIHTDRQYVITSECNQLESISDETTDPLFNAAVSPEFHTMVLHRHNVEVYLGPGSRWALTWDPANSYAEDYHTIYTNGQVSAYVSPNEK